MTRTRQHWAAAAIGAVVLLGLGGLTVHLRHGDDMLFPWVHAPTTIGIGTGQTIARHVRPVAHDQSVATARERLAALEMTLPASAHDVGVEDVDYEVLSGAPYEAVTIIRFTVGADEFDAFTSTPPLSGLGPGVVLDDSEPACFAPNLLDIVGKQLPPGCLRTGVQIDSPDGTWTDVEVRAVSSAPDVEVTVLLITPPTR